MLDEKKLIKPDPFDIYRFERYLYNELFIYNTINDHQKPLNINNTLLELESVFQTRSYFESETSKRKQIAPVWKTALSMWIYEIEHYMLGKDLDSDDLINLDYNQSLIKNIYINTTAGITKYLHHYARELVVVTKSGDIEKRVLIENFLKDMSRGVSIAFILPKLKEELESLKGQPDLTKTELQSLDYRSEKDKLSTKQQILLLHKLGIFDLEQIQSLTEQKRGILFGNLLNRNEKNAEDTIRNRHAQLPEKIQAPVLDLLKKLGLEKN